MTMATEGEGRSGARTPRREAWGLLAGLVYPPRVPRASPAELGRDGRRCLRRPARSSSEPQTMGDDGRRSCTATPPTSPASSTASKQKGLAERRARAEHDRRVKLIALTAEGRRLRARVAARDAASRPAWLRGPRSAADQRALLDDPRTRLLAAAATRSGTVKTNWLPISWVSFYNLLTAGEGPPTLTPFGDEPLGSRYGVRPFQPHWERNEGPDSQRRWEAPGPAKSER